MPNPIPDPTKAAATNLGAATQTALERTGTSAQTNRISPARLSEIEAALAGIAGPGFAEVHEDGEWLAECAPGSCKLRGDGQDLILHLRYDERSLARRVVRLAEQSTSHVVLEVMRFGQTKPGRLEFIRTESRKPRNRIKAEIFRGRLARLFAENFPDAQVSSLSATQNMTRYFSGLYVRGMMAEQGVNWALLAVPPGSSAATINGALTFALTWVHWSREHLHEGPVAGLRILVPDELVEEIQHQARWLNSRALVQIFALAENSDYIGLRDQADLGNLQSDLIPRWEVERLIGQGGPAIERIRKLAPDEVEHVAADLEFETEDVALRFRGLEFARWTGGRIELDLKRPREKHSSSHKIRQEPTASGTSLNLALHPALDRDEALKNFLAELSLRRNPLACDTRHPLYRSAPEHWLETLILADPLRLDATLDPRFLYSQVPAFAHSHQGIIDLVGVTRKGRVVVIELKVSEEIQLVAQGLRYWMRVRQHLQNGDFARLGYFPGVELDRKSPLLWLVAPSLHFHPAMDTMLKYISPEVEVTRIGINENWRRGVRVTFRQ